MNSYCRICHQPAVDGSVFCATHRDEARTFAAAFGRLSAPGPEPAAQTQAVEVPGQAAVLGVFADLCDRISSGRDIGTSWPRISVYCLDGHILARPYFSVIPHAEVVSTTDEFQLTDEATRKALAPGGEVLSAAEQQIVTSLDALGGGQVLTVDIHLVTYAGVIAINRQLPDGTEENVAVFRRVGDEFVATTMNEVRGRLRHQRW